MINPLKSIKKLSCNEVAVRRLDAQLKTDIEERRNSELNKRRILEIRNATHGKIGHPHSEVKYFAIR